MEHAKIFQVIVDVCKKKKSRFNAQLKLGHNENQANLPIIIQNVILRTIEKSQI